MMAVRIVLDTNSFYGDVHATRPKFRALLASAAARDVEVIVPQVVLDELARQYPERLSKAEADLDKAIGKVDTELKRLGVSMARPNVEFPVGADGYASQLRTRLIKSRVRVVPHPTDFAAFIGRCVAKRKPFKESGEGLPDALIWDSVASAARGSDVILVTSNTKDFSDPSDATRLHGDLVDELAAQHIPPTRVRIVPDVDSLIDEIIRPLSLPDARAERLIRDPVVGPRLRSGLGDALRYELVPESSLGLDVELIEDPRIVDARIHEVNLNVARELAPGRLLLDLNVTADLELEAIVDVENEEELLRSANLILVDRSNNDYFLGALTEVSVVLRVEVTTDLDAHQVDDVDLKSVKSA
jgi:predicted nucleic acid-binding protein